VKRLLTVVAIAMVAACVTPAVVKARPPARLSPAAQSLSRCVQTNGRLSVLMLIDESGSLAATDPFNQRVDGIRAALTGLANLSESSVDGDLEVSVLMAGFFGQVHPDPEDGEGAGAWKPVGRENLDQLLEEAGQYENLNHGRATDYVTALTAARQLLAERAAEQTEDGGAAPCQALIWFTDGRYALPQRVGKAGVGLPLELPYAPGIRLDKPGAGEEAVAAGKQEMCKPNGLMDQIQGDGVIRFTVALSTDLAREDAAFLDAATTGSAGARRCGAHLSEVSGEYLSARDGDRLFFAFAGLGGTPAPIRVKEICPRLACVRGLSTFATVPGLSHFLIRASGGAEGPPSNPPRPLSLELKVPTGETVTLRAGGPDQVTLAGTTINPRWVSSRAVEVEGDFSPGDEWLGRWSYSLIDPATAPRAPASRSYSAVQLFTDLEPTVEGKPVLIRGTSTPLEFKFVQGSDPDQAITSGPLIRASHLVASIEDPIAGTSTDVPVAGPAPDGTFSARVTIPPSSTAGFVYLGLTGSFATATGTPVAPQYRSFDLPVRFPPGHGFPTITPSSLDLPSLQGDGTAEGTLTVKGSSVSSGCVWFGPPEIDAPDEAGAVTPKVAPAAGNGDSCVQLGKGEEQTFTVQLTPAAEASGTVTASIPVHLRSDLIDDESVVTIPATFAMAPKPDVVKRLFLLVFLILLGGLLPILLLHLLNRSGAKFPAPNRLRLIRLPVEMTRGGGLRPRGEGELKIDRGDSLAGHGSNPVRELDIGGLELEAIASGSLRDRTFQLFRGPYGVARAGGRKLTAGAKQPLRSWGGETAQEVPLDLGGTWIFRLDALHPAERVEAEDAGTLAAATAEPSPRSERDHFFGQPAGAAQSSQPPPPPPQPREATIDGELFLLIHDAPPYDQGNDLFEAAAQGLKAADELWEEPRPEPAPAADEAEPVSAEEPEEPSFEPPPPAPQEPQAWSPSAEPRESGGKPKKRGSSDDFF
jgi:hypothetical protein